VTKPAALACGAALLLLPAAAPATPAPQQQLHVLAFTKTAAFRHDSIPAAVRAVRELGAANRIAVDTTEDAAAFVDARLARYDAVIFLLTSGDVLDDGQQAAFERYVQGGGGYVGVHSAADTEYDWPWYGELVGAAFRNHPRIQRAAIQVLAREASTVRLPRRWVRTDEWYGFKTSPSTRVRVLARLDESSYEPGESAMGDDHPIVWAHEVGKGRSWYTGGGHTSEAYAEPLFRSHLLGGILYAAGYPGPRVAALAVTSRSRRVTVAVRLKGCLRCAGRLRVRLAGTWRASSLRASENTLRATTGVLPVGRLRLELVLEDRASGVTATVSRTVTVRR
jgi:type 1 glutamine amidotransferase